MNTIDMVIVPLWLNSIMEELGISDEDLLDCEKLSNILSSRDILIYKLVNRSDHRNALLGEKLSLDFGTCVPVPDVLEVYQYTNMNTIDLIFGAHQSAKSDSLHIEMKLIGQDTVGLFYCLKEDGANVENNGWVEDLTHLLHGRVSLSELSRYDVFKQLVDIV